MRELTSGNPAKMILAFAVPIVLGSLFQQLYSMTDTVIVGRTIGVDAIAAIGSTSYISNLIIGFMSGLTNGFAIVTARHFGAGDHVKMRRSVAGTIILGLLTSAVFTVLSLVFLRPFLAVLNTPPEIFETAYNYISVILTFMTAAMLYNMSAGVLRAVGDSLTPLLFLILSSFINIGLDIGAVQLGAPDLAVQTLAGHLNVDADGVVGAVLEAELGAAPADRGVKPVVGHIANHIHVVIALNYFKLRIHSRAVDGAGNLTDAAAHLIDGVAADVGGGCLVASCGGALTHHTVEVELLAGIEDKAVYHLPQNQQCEHETAHHFHTPAQVGRP